MQPLPDKPGTNLELRPAEAPEWIKPALGVTAEEILQIIGARAYSGKVPERRPAAVLMVLSGDSIANASVLLTHRSPHLRSHSGQIAFPGGRHDPTDINLVDTAMREAWEETGLNREEIIPLADSGQIYVPAAGNRINSILSYWAYPGAVGVINKEEADDVFIQPLEELLAPENRLTVAFDAWTAPAFRINGYIIWGFTASVLTATFDKAGWAKEWDQERVESLSTVLASSRNNERRAF